MAYGDYYIKAAKQSQTLKPVQPYGSAAKTIYNPYGSTTVAAAAQLSKPSGGTPPQTSSISSNQVAQPMVASGATDAGGEGYAYPEFNVDLSGIWETAGALADNEINPQLIEIDRLLQEAGYTAEESERAINEAYPIARRSLQKSIYENMVAGEKGLAAMGTGRGGGRQELLARAGEREATGVEAIETQKMRETGAIKRALENYRGQMGTTKTGLLGQRGNLQAAYAESIRGNRFNEAGTIYNAALGKANLAESARQFNESLKASTSGVSGQSGYLNQFTGGTYTPTVEEINSLFGGSAVAIPKTTALQRYQASKYKGKNPKLVEYQMSKGY